jgi:hypothetical protein
MIRIWIPNKGGLEQYGEKNLVLSHLLLAGSSANGKGRRKKERKKNLKLVYLTSPLFRFLCGGTRCSK